MFAVESIADGICIEVKETIEFCEAHSNRSHHFKLQETKS